MKQLDFGTTFISISCVFTTLDTAWAYDEEEEDLNKIWNRLNRMLSTQRQAEQLDGA